ncbi:DUF368 domain-containing protein [Treponema sp.]|uniref:DUF368 domain-containing protein n=1 Tax=Treponema sp. TaxID=166 RepID=UPI00388D57D9
MNVIKDILRGIAIGIANIIPGVSGGTMMVSMGIYDKIISCISHFFNDIKGNIKFLIPIVLGMAIAVVGGSFTIEYLFKAFPLPTTIFFVGLILGGLPAMIKKVKGEKPNILHIVFFLIFFALIIGLALLSGTEGSQASTAISFVNVIIFFFVGLIAAATMVIPGVSGSMVLLLMGYYNPILTEINNFIRSLINLDVSGLLHGFGVLCPFGLGVLFGIVAVAKLIEYIFNKFPRYAYYSIIGLIAASPFAMILLGSFPAVTVLSVAASVICFAAGFIITVKLGE